jgi:hypothetical protein
MSSDLYAASFVSPPIAIVCCVLLLGPFYFLGAFSTFLKTTINCTMSILLSVLPHETTRFPLIFKKFGEYFSKVCREISQLSLNSEKNNGHFHEDGCTFMTISG